MALAEIVERLPLSASVRDAIVDHAGASGQLLDCAIALDAARLDDIDWAALDRLGIDKSALREAYIESLRWVSTVLDSLP